MVLSWMLLALVPSMLDDKDVAAALTQVEQALPWTWQFSVTHVQLQEVSPYTLRFDFVKGETERQVDCQRPWRSNSWMCDER
mgnify:CR=1 FL=1